MSSKIKAILLILSSINENYQTILLKRIFFVVLLPSLKKESDFSLSAYKPEDAPLKTNIHVFIRTRNHS